MRAYHISRASDYSSMYPRYIKIVISIFAVTTLRASNQPRESNSRCLETLRGRVALRRHKSTRSRGIAMSLFPIEFLPIPVRTVVGRDRAAFLFRRILLRATTLWPLLSLRRTLSPLRHSVAKNHRRADSQGHTPHSDEKLSESK